VVESQRQDWASAPKEGPGIGRIGLEEIFQHPQNITVFEISHDMFSAPVQWGLRVKAPEISSSGVV